MSSTENPGPDRLSRAEGEVPGVFCPHPDLAEVVRVQFDERVGIFIGRFDHAFDGHMMNPVANHLAAGMVVPREPGDHATGTVQRLQ